MRGENKRYSGFNETRVVEPRRKAMAVLSRRSVLISAVSSAALAGRLGASDSEFWNSKPPADWTIAELGRLLNDSPWAKPITPVYISLPPPPDNRPWNEAPPIGRGPIPPRHKRLIKAPYDAIIRWESAKPIRDAQKTVLPPAFGGYHVLGIYFLHATRRDFGAKPLDNLKESAILSGARAAKAEIVQAHPKTADGFLVGFPITSARGVRRFEFSARVGFLALKAKFETHDMQYHGQLAI